MDDAPEVMQVFFLSDSTGISAETMGNALLLQFPHLIYERRLIPFIITVDEARRVVSLLDAAAEHGKVVAFSTTAVEEVRQELRRTSCPLIDFFDVHIHRLEGIFGQPGVRQAARLHGMGDVKRYNARMAAVEYALEHDDGQSMRALDKAEVVLLAPSRCGKTPTAMYLALQHGVLVANYPLLEEDLQRSELPLPIKGLGARCFGLTTTPARLAAVREQRMAQSEYSSLRQCASELRRAERLYQAHGIPTIDSSTRSVEEMSTQILQALSQS
ncbi:pyruvate, water dikinase regulatory protein [Amnibacterium flavum]|nr:pyruvate, water dikinase regulatory protein [Amnibacterium flavum]